MKELDVVSTKVVVGNLPIGSVGTIVYDLSDTVKMVEFLGDTSEFHNILVSDLELVKSYND